MRILFWTWLFFVSLPFIAIFVVCLGLEMAKDGIVYAVGRAWRAAAARSAGKE